MKISPEISLLSVGIAIVAIFILGIVVFLNNRKSITNKIFFIFSLITIIWSILNYLSFQFNNPILILWILRFVMFLAVWQTFSIFTLFYVSPYEKINFSKWYKFGILPLVIFISFFTLTPAVFKGIKTLAPIGQTSVMDVGLGIIMFGLLAISLVSSGFILLIKKIINKKDAEKKQLIFLLIGAGIFFISLIIFNFILPAFFNNPNFIPLSAIFTFPFIAFTAYAIIKHGLFNIKLIATELLIFAIWIFLLIDTLSGINWQERLLRGIIFILTIIFGIFLIRSVKKEIKQKENLEKLAKELETTNQKLIEIDKMKAAMFSFVSHQIKAPMAIIKGFVQLLLAGSYGELSEKIKGTMMTIKDSNERLLKLVEDFLDLRRIEEGKMDYNFKDTNIAGLVKSVFEELKPLAEQKKIELTLDCNIQEIKISADEQRFRQVIFNLIENSIKYTESGFVKVKLAINAELEIIFSVEDSGIGISKECLPHLFDEFIRAKTETVRHIKGTGLGLYIAKQIVEAHKGEVWAESDGEGKGSRFVVKLKI